MTTDTSTQTTPGAGEQNPAGAPAGTDPNAAQQGAQGNPQGAPQGEQKPQGQQAPAGEQVPINTATGKPWTITDALATIKDLRDKDASKRVERKGLPDALRALAAAAGLEDALSDETPTVESLGKDLQAKQVDLQRATERADKAEGDLAVIRAAWAAGISPEREGYLSFLMSSDTEVQAARGTDQFGATVSSKITALAGSDPMLKGNAGSGGRASGPDSFGGANGSSAITPEQFEAMSYDERLDLFQKNPEEYRRLSAG